MAKPTPLPTVMISTNSSNLFVTFVTENCDDGMDHVISQRTNECIFKLKLQIKTFFHSHPKTPDEIIKRRGFNWWFADKLVLFA